MTSKKTVPMLLGQTLLPQEKRQARIGSEAKTKTFLRSFALIAIRNGII